MSNATFSQILFDCHKLEHISAENCHQLTRIDVPSSLADWKRVLTSLNVNYCSLESGSIANLARHFPALARVDLTRDTKDPPRLTDMRVLADSCTGLKEVNISGCIQTAEEESELCHLYSTCAHLSCLVLSCCYGLTEKTLRSMGKVGSCQLTEVSLAFVDSLSDEALHSFLVREVRLARLNVSYCKRLSDSTIYQLLGTGDFRELSYVDILQCNDISQTAMLHLARACVSLRHLVVNLSQDEDFAQQMRFVNPDLLVHMWTTS
jgi:hypothetical protein